MSMLSRLKYDLTMAEAARGPGGSRVDLLVVADMVARGARVLDVGCGDGTTALPAARLGADVVGVDIASNLIAAARGRAEREGLTNIRFEEGDASHLDNLAAGTFDLVVSVFGAMFAPRPFDVARELVRVTRAGGRVVMGNWIPGDPTLVAQILRISGSYSPPPPEGFISPVTWGVEANVIERFGAAGIATNQIECAEQTYLFEYEGSPTELVATFRDFYGPTMNAYAAAEANGAAADLQRELEDLFTSQNTSADPHTTSIAATFLEVTVHV